MSYITVELTRKRRGGIIGERSVYVSFTAPVNRVTHPTTRSAMVDFEDPGLNGKIQLWNYDIRIKDAYSWFHSRWSLIIKSQFLRWSEVNLWNQTRGDVAWTILGGVGWDWGRKTEHQPRRLQLGHPIRLNSRTTRIQNLQIDEETPMVNSRWEATQQDRTRISITISKKHDQWAPLKKRNC